MVTRKLRFTFLSVGAGLSVLFLSVLVLAQESRPNLSILSYVKARDDLSLAVRRAWAREVKMRFGGSALSAESVRTPEIGVAKAILASAMFMEIDAKKGVLAAWEGWRGALGYVPPPIAVHYQVLALKGQRPKGRPIDLAFDFPKFYSEEIAPDLVAYWEEALKDGRIGPHALRETQEALQKTRVRMRPLLVDKLRLLARLAKEEQLAQNTARKRDIARDRQELEHELARAFSKVPKSPAVADARRSPFARLRTQLKDMQLPLSDEDRWLDPRSGQPPPTLSPPDRWARPQKPSSLTPPPDRPRTPRKRTSPSQPPADAQKPSPEKPAPQLQVPPQVTLGPPRLPPSSPFWAEPAKLVGVYRSQLTSVVDPWIGTPYKWGRSHRGQGTDCSGFTRSVFSEAFRLTLPRVSRDQYRVGQRVAYQQLKPGDLVFFDFKDRGRVNHVGVYVGDGRFAHAGVSRGVVYARLGAKWFRKSYRGARRILAYP